MVEVAVAVALGGSSVGLVGRREGGVQPAHAGTRNIGPGGGRGGG